MHARPERVFLPLFAGILAAACARSTLQIDLVTPPGFDLAAEITGELTVRLVGADGATVARTAIAHDKLLVPGIVLRGQKVAIGSPMSIALDAQATGCAAGFARGRSRAFVHTEAGETVPVYFGCADALYESAAGRAEANYLPAVVALADGSALFAGGTRRIVAAVGRFDLEPVATVEQFDPATERFGTRPNLPAALALHGMILWGDGTPWVFGGLDTSIGPVTPANGVYALQGGAWASPPALATARWGVRAFFSGATDEAVLVGTPAAATGAVRYARDGTQTNLGAIVRVLPAVTDLPDGRIVIAGGGLDTLDPATELPPTEMVDPAAGTATTLGPSPLGRWQFVAAAALGCPDASSVGYFFGGIATDAAGTRPRSEIYCVRAGGGPAVDSSALELAGAMPGVEGTRTAAAAVVIRGPRGPSTRILVVGGTTGGVFDARTVLAYEPDGCSCAAGCACSGPMSATELPVPNGVQIAWPSAVRLADGTVLVVGAGSRTLAGATVTYTPSAAVYRFNPDDVPAP